jgi:chemotaxis protein MotB
MSILLVAALALGGCVPKAQYMKLQPENKELKQRVERLDSIAEANLKAYRELLADFKPLIDRGLLKVEVVDGRITLGMASDVLFASGSAELSQAGKDNIGEITKVLAAKSKDRDFQVEGHTDSEPINTPQYPSNWHLGAARAIAVTQFMVARGFPEDQISAASFARRP